jgi:hypothetical protein
LVSKPSAGGDDTRGVELRPRQYDIWAGALDASGREALCRYVLRPAVAQERVMQGSDGLVRISLKNPLSDGTVAVDLDPLSLLCRMAVSVPPPRFHTVRYAGVLAPASKLRSRIVPKPIATPCVAVGGVCVPESPGTGLCGGGGFRSGASCGDAAAYCCTPSRDAAQDVGEGGDGGGASLSLCTFPTPLASTRPERRLP